MQDWQFRKEKSRVPPAKKIVVGKTLGAPKHVNLVLQVKNPNSPKWRWTSHHSKTLRMKMRDLISRVALYTEVDYLPIGLCAD